VLATADEWPPSLPAFRKMCCGIPTFGQVAWELQTPQTRGHASPFSHLVWSLLDHHRYGHATVDVADRLLTRAYRVAVEQALRMDSTS
jgi:hypothetical protein